MLPFMRYPWAYFRLYCISNFTILWITRKSFDSLTTFSNLLHSCPCEDDRGDCLHLHWAPLRSDIANILDWVLNQDFTTAYRDIMELKMLKGLVLHDILIEIKACLCRAAFPSWIRVHLLTKMAGSEYRLCVGINEKIQLSSLIATFQVTRDWIVVEA